MLGLRHRRGDAVAARGRGPPGPLASVPAGRPPSTESGASQKAGFVLVFGVSKARGVLAAEISHFFFPGDGDVKDGSRSHDRGPHGSLFACGLTSWLTLSV